MRFLYLVRGRFTTMRCDSTYIGGNLTKITFLIPPYEDFKNDYLCLELINLKNMNDFFEKIAAEIAAKVCSTLGQTTNERMENQYLTTEEVCRRLGVSKTTLFRFRKEGMISPSYFIGRSPRFTEEDIENYLKEAKK